MLNVQEPKKQCSHLVREMVSKHELEFCLWRTFRRSTYKVTKVIPPVIKNKTHSSKSYSNLSMKEVSSRCFPHFQIYLEFWGKTSMDVFIVHLLWSTSGTSSCKSINPTTLCLLSAYKETVNNPQGTALILFYFFSFFHSFSFFLLLFLVCFFFFFLFDSKMKAAQKTEEIYLSHS